MEWLSGLNFPTIGAGALVSAFVIAIYTGRLVPRSTVDSLVEGARSERDTWKGIAGTNGDTADQAMRQVDTLLVTVSTMEAVLKALPAPSTRPPEAGTNGT